jgi:hypothetical protein
MFNIYFFQLPSSGLTTTMNQLIQKKGLVALKRQLKNFFLYQSIAIEAGIRIGGCGST